MSVTGEEPDRSFNFRYSEIAYYDNNGGTYKASNYGRQASESYEVLDTFDVSSSSGHSIGFTVKDSNNISDNPDIPPVEK